jgi:hypothetical protein
VEEDAEGVVQGGRVMDDREKLVGLLDVIVQPGQKTLGEIADHLLSNGVTFATDTNVGSKWIPVSERLPRSRESVLIYSSDGGSAEGCYNESTKTWRQYRWRAEGLPVTHWMPPPEPPKEDE